MPHTSPGIVITVILDLSRKHAFCKIQEHLRFVVLRHVVVWFWGGNPSIHFPYHLTQHCFCNRINSKFFREVLKALLDVPPDHRSNIMPKVSLGNNFLT